NVAAHHAGTDDVNVAGRRGFPAAERLEPLLQEKVPHQVPRRRRAHESCDRLRFRLVTGTRARTVAPPEIHDRVGRGIVLASCTPRDPCFDAWGDDATHWRE